MTLYELDSWEHNQAYDSDWYAIVYDTETQKLSRVEIGTTRFGDALPRMRDGCHVIGDTVLLKPTEEILKQAQLALRDQILPLIEIEERQRIFVLNPKKIEDGAVLRFTEKHKCALKEFDIEDCIKCNGSGHWTNPRNTSDKRSCFSCKGTGKHKRNFRKVVDDNGKVVWQRIEAGTTGTVVNMRSYGTFYSNGYNKPDGFNTTVILRLEDGREVQAPLRKLQLPEDMPSKEELLKKADVLAQKRGFYLPFRTANIRF